MLNYFLNFPFFSYVELRTILYNFINKSQLFVYIFHPLANYYRS